MEPYTAFKTFQEWQAWIRSCYRNFRPVTFDLIMTCIRTERCRFCPSRFRCPLRAMLYAPELDFETKLQSVTVDMMEVFQIQDNISAIWAQENQLRQKRQDELTQHPGYYSPT